MTVYKKKGNIFIISAPSGAGKTTLCRAALDRIQNILYSVSFTSREPRHGERQGIDYNFISKQEFEKEIKEQKWAEWAKVHGNYYGTSADYLNYCLSNGKNLILDIDIQGACQIVNKFPDSITFFIMPPSIEVLRDRLEKRGTDSAVAIKKRLANARKEIAKKDHYRHIIINNERAEAIRELTNLIKTYL